MTPLRGVSMLVVASGALACLSCQDTWSSIDLERMIDQPVAKPFRGSPYFEDGRVMQAPPENTVPVNRVLGPEPLIEGTDRGVFVNTFPVRLDRAAMERGRTRFDVFCAACHGVDGSGTSQVAIHMELRKPPALIAEPVRSYPLGRVYRAITHGYGLMPAYQRDLSLADRWAVTGYVRALQRSRETAIASLPESVRREAEEALR
jgi:mono/diheme cytochrome c family protein